MASPFVVGYITAICPRNDGWSTPMRTTPTTSKLLGNDDELKVSTLIKRRACVPSSTAMVPVFAERISTTTFRPSYFIALSAPMSETWLSNALFASAS